MRRHAGTFGRGARLAVCIGVWMLHPVQVSAASLTARDVQIIARTLGFLDPAPAGGMVAVVFAAGNSASRADAQAIAALFGAGLPSRAGAITARAVDARTLADGAGYIAIILAVGAVADSAGGPATRLLSISGVDSLVQSGQCVMAVHSQPRVDIVVNRAAARAAGVGFTAAFGLLVHEI